MLTGTQISIATASAANARGFLQVVIENPRLYRCRLDLYKARRGFPMNASDYTTKCSGIMEKKCFRRYELLLIVEGDSPVENDRDGRGWDVPSKHSFRPGD